MFVIPKYTMGWKPQREDSFWFMGPKGSVHDCLVHGFGQSTGTEETAHFIVDKKQKEKREGYNLQRHPPPK